MGSRRGTTNMSTRARIMDQRYKIYIFISVTRRELGAEICFLLEILFYS